MIVLVVLAKGLTVNLEKLEGNLNVEAVKNRAPNSSDAVVFLDCGNTMPQIEPDVVYMIGECIAYPDLLVNNKLDSMTEWEPALIDQLQTTFEGAAESTELME